MEHQDDHGIRIAAVLGTARPGNFTSKALALVIDEINRQENIALDVIEPGTMNLPLPGTDPESDVAKALRGIVAKATGVVFSTPEYHGSYSSLTKLVIENLGFPSVLATKPVALVGVAAGQIGAIKALEHLRSVLSHVGAIVLPGPVSVARVRTVFDEEGRCLDGETERRIRGVATNLIDYIRSNICPRMAPEQLVRQEAAKRAA
ncbi:MAG: NADPH-dependent FMN reductase [Kiloniellaceae bacterium]